MVKIIKPGFYTNIQDLGRHGFQHYGVPISGAMDQNASQLANALLNNNRKDAVMELTMTGPSLQFYKNANICVCGADMTPKLNDRLISMNSVIPIKKGDILSFGKLNSGFRAYLAISGGFQTVEIMNSRSMFDNISTETKLLKNDEINYLEHQEPSIRPNSKIRQGVFSHESDSIDVFKGPEFEFLSRSQRDVLSFQKFTVSKYNNRMAYQLEERLQNIIKPIITSMVLPGTVQLTPSGQLIILMRDCQTTGGYPRILQLSDSAINKMAQKTTSNYFRFKLIDDTFLTVVE